MDDITKQEDLISKMKAGVKIKRSNRWWHWVEHSWEHNEITFTDGSEDSGEMDRLLSFLEEVRRLVTGLKTQKKHGDVYGP
eukprot:6301565-Heterocapsa_arctica.AAC.1